MKKLTLLLVCISSMLLFGFQCRDVHIGVWYAINYTNQTLILKLTRNASVIRNDTVASGKSVSFKNLYFSNPERPDFVDWFRHSSIGENSSYEVLSADGVLLKKWTSEDRNLSGKQFFNESSWRHEEEVDDGEIFAEWIFDILPEDLVEP